MTDIDYLAARRKRGTPAEGKPLRPSKPRQGPIPKSRRQYRNPRILKAECAAEYWRAIADLTMIPNAHPERAVIEREAQTWYRFATTPHAFTGDNNG